MAEAPEQPVHLSETNVAQSTDDKHNFTLKDILERDTRIATVVYPGTQTSINYSKWWEDVVVATQNCIPRTINAAEYNSYATGTPVPGQLEFTLRDGSTAQALEFPKQIIASSDVIADKLRNFQFFRANLSVTVKFNSTRFQQGLVALVYEPYYNALNDFWKYGNKFLASMTTFPHTLLNLEVSNSATLQIPYCSEYDYFNISGGVEGGFGTITLYALTPFGAITGDTSVEGYVTARFCDIEYYTPTAEPINSTFLSDRQQRINEARYAVHQGEIEEAAKPGPVTKVSGTIATIASGMSKVPVVGKYAAPVSWIARGVEGVASMFGWSKPVNVSTTQRVTRNPAYGFTHLEGMDDSVTLGAIADNGVENATVNPFEKDEMALGHLFSVPNAIDRFNWSVADDVGKILFVQRVEPINPKQMSADVDNTTVHAGEYSLGSFSYTTSFAELWRGTIEYTLSLVKTQYHSGRLLVQYYPEKIPTTVADISEVFSLVIDITRKDGGIPITDYTVPIPFASDLPWRLTGDTSTLDETVKVLNDNNSFNGYMVISVYNKLVAPSTVADNVSAVIWHNGGDDFKLALPRTHMRPGITATEGIITNFEVSPSAYAAGAFPAWRPSVDCTGTFTTGDIIISNTTPWLDINEVLSGGSYQLAHVVKGQFDTYTFSASKRYNIKAHGNAPEVNFTLSCFGGGPITWSREDTRATHQFGQVPTKLKLFASTQTEDPSPSTTGEYFESLRALIKRTAPLTTVSSSGDSVTPNVIVPMNFQDPNRFTVADNLGVPDLLAVGAMYRFWSGSVRTKIFPTSDGVVISQLARARADSPGALTTNPVISALPAHISYTSVNPVHETTLPFYSAKRARVIGGISDSRPYRVSSHRLDRVPPGTNSYQIAAGDDFSYFFLSGPPLVKVQGSGIKAT